jgi:hypothetical protein
MTYKRRGKRFVPTAQPTIRQGTTGTRSAAGFVWMTPPVAVGDDQRSGELIEGA